MTRLSSVLSFLAVSVTWFRSRTLSSSSSRVDLLIGSRLVADHQQHLSYSVVLSVTLKVNVC